jgi:glutamine amidotransferase PdxT
MMGSSQASGYAECVGEGLCSLEVAVQAHLQSNCFPPVTSKLVPACVEAIQACEDEDYDRPVILPNGESTTAGYMVERLHLDAFVQYKEE